MWIAAAAALADRVTKALAVRAGAGGALIPGIVNIAPTANRGVAFSMLSGRTLLATVLSAVLIAGLTAWLIARPGGGRWMRAGLWFIVGGGLGNLYDRLVLGSVIDFVELAFVRFAVFNVADVCICVGAALAAIGAFKAPENGEDDDAG